MSAKPVFLFAVAISAVTLGMFCSTCFAQRSSSQSSSSRSSTSGSGGSGTSGLFSQQLSFSDSLSTTSGSSNNGGFVGSGSGTDFIGSSSNGTTSGQRSSTRSSYSSSGSRNTSNRSAGQQYGGRSGSMNRNTQVQPVYTLGFTAPKRDAGTVSVTLDSRLSNVARNNRLNAMQINVSEGIATVRGTVASEHDRKVVENMIRLQPGVTEIRNEIQIESSATPAGLSTSVRQGQRDSEVTEITTSQGQPLVYVF